MVMNSYILSVSVAYHPYLPKSSMARVGGDLLHNILLLK